MELHDNLKKPWLNDGLKFLVSEYYERTVHSTSTITTLLDIAVKDGEEQRAYQPLEVAKVCGRLYLEGMLAAEQVLAMKVHIAF